MTSINHHRFAASLRHENLKQEDDPGYAIFELSSAVSLVSDLLAKGVDDETLRALMAEQQRLYGLLRHAEVNEEAA